MKLSYSGGDLVDFYSSESTTTNLTAVLEDSGNFVLKDANSRSHHVLWQSFDSPTESFVPGMKLGTNRQTGRTWSLTSWLSEEVPTPGPFTLEWDRNGLELVIKRRGVTFWTSGPIILGYDDLTSSRICNGFVNFNLHGGPLDYTFINVSNVDEDYLMFAVNAAKYHPEASMQGKNKFSSLQLQFDGTIYDKALSLSPVQGLCDGNSKESGCERWGGPKRSSNGERCELRSGYFVHDESASNVYKKASLGIGDCKDIFWKNCQCVRH